jgi:hypothetical protein
VRGLFEFGVERDSVGGVARDRALNNSAPR